MLARLRCLIGWHYHGEPTGFVGYNMLGMRMLEVRCPRCTRRYWQILLDRMTPL